MHNRFVFKLFLIQTKTDDSVAFAFTHMFLSTRDFHKLSTIRECHLVIWLDGPADSTLASEAYGKDLDSQLWLIADDEQKFPLSNWYLSIMTNG